MGEGFWASAISNRLLSQTWVLEVVAVGLAGFGSSQEAADTFRQGYFTKVSRHGEEENLMKRTT